MTGSISIIDLASFYASTIDTVAHEVNDWYAGANQIPNKELFDQSVVCVYERLVGILFESKHDIRIANMPISDISCVLSKNLANKYQFISCFQASKTETHRGQYISKTSYSLALAGKNAILTTVNTRAADFIN